MGGDETKTALHAADWTGLDEEILLRDCVLYGGS